jgi:hypothetical protein
MKADWQRRDGEPPGKPDFLKAGSMFLFAVILVAVIWLLLK